MRVATTRKMMALITSASVLASLAVASVTAPAAAGKPMCGGKVATIVGTWRGEVIVGTPTGDVIVARGGHDKIFGRGGHDIICGNGGNDRIYGGPGNDTAFGKNGRDQLFGGPDRDLLYGGPHDDQFAGGIGIDGCYQGSGFGLIVTCEKGSVPPLAIAYTDMDGNHAFGPGDVMISRLVDTDGDRVPSKGDTIVMGRYPTTLTPTSAADFEPWKVKKHGVEVITSQDTDAIVVESTTGGDFKWFRTSAGHYDKFVESNAGGESSIGDQQGTDSDYIMIELSSPSYPAKVVSRDAAGTGDDRLIDVDLNY